MTIGRNFEAFSGTTTTVQPLMKVIDTLPKLLQFYRQHWPWLRRHGYNCIWQFCHFANTRRCGTAVISCKKHRVAVKIRKWHGIATQQNPIYGTIYLSLTMLRRGLVCFAEWTCFDAFAMHFSTIAISGFNFIMRVRLLLIAFAVNIVMP